MIQIKHKPECKICYGEYNGQFQPFILLCGHSFCKECLQTIKNKCIYCKQQSEALTNNRILEGFTIKNTLCENCHYPFHLSGNQIMRTKREIEDMVCRECVESEQIEITLPYAVKNLELCSMQDENKQNITEMQNKFFDENIESNQQVLDIVETMKNQIETQDVIDECQKSLPEIKDICENSKNKFTIVSGKIKKFLNEETMFKNFDYQETQHKKKFLADLKFMEKTLKDSLKNLEEGKSNYINIYANDMSKQQKLEQKLEEMYEHFCFHEQQNNIIQVDQIDQQIKKEEILNIINVQKDSEKAIKYLTDQVAHLEGDVVFAKFEEMKQLFQKIENLDLGIEKLSIDIQINPIIKQIY